jgi:hypothetical protein
VHFGGAPLWGTRNFIGIAASFHLKPDLSDDHAVACRMRGPMPQARLYRLHPKQYSHPRASQPYVGTAPCRVATRNPKQPGECDFFRLAFFEIKARRCQSAVRPKVASLARARIFFERGDAPRARRKHWRKFAAASPRLPTLCAGPLVRNLRRKCVRSVRISELEAARVRSASASSATSISRRTRA